MTILSSTILDDPQEDLERLRRLLAPPGEGTLLGFRAAEEFIFDDASTGAADHLQRVIQTARAIVTQCGMDPGLSAAVFEAGSGLHGLGASCEPALLMCEAAAAYRDETVVRLLVEAQQTARTIPSRHRRRPEAWVLTPFDRETPDDGDLAEPQDWDDVLTPPLSPVQS
jgi:cell division protease FtsH